MSDRSLPDKVVAVDKALASIPHAFGGALALAYYAEPRATIDIDLNVFVPSDRVDEVVGPLEQLGADITGATTAALRYGQLRVRWDGTDVDLFFSYDPFHDAAAKAVAEVPFADTTLPILSAAHLTVCKVWFDRAKDWVDIDAMLALGTAIDAGEVLRWVGRIAGDDDPRFDRIAAVLSASG